MVLLSGYHSRVKGVLGGLVRTRRRGPTGICLRPKPLVDILGSIIDIAPLDSSESGGQGFSITVGNAAEILTDCHLGDSIAINGTDPSHFLPLVFCLLPLAEKQTRKRTACSFFSS